MMLVVFRGFIFHFTFSVLAWVLFQILRYQFGLDIYNYIILLQCCHAFQFGLLINTLKQQLWKLRHSFLLLQVFPNSFLTNLNLKLIKLTARNLQSNAGFCQPSYLKRIRNFLLPVFPLTPLNVVMHYQSNLFNETYN